MTKIEKNKQMEVIQSANIVADEWAPYTNTHKVSKILIFPLFDSITFMDGPADQAEWTMPPIKLHVCN